MNYGEDKINKTRVLAASRRRFTTERIRKIIKANDRNDWFNLLGLIILITAIIFCVIYYAMS